MGVAGPAYHIFRSPCRWTIISKFYFSISIIFFRYIIDPYLQVAVLWTAGCILVMIGIQAPPIPSDTPVSVICGLV